MAAKVKKGDRVIVLSGRSKGVEGEVLKMMPAEGRCLVRGVNVVKRHTKPTQDDPQGGIRSFEAPIDVSNVALLDPRDGKPTRVGFKIDEHGRKTRFAKRSGEALDV
ncbi:MAG: 50S ribosomal protein L24 [Henriciella sp.]|nr:50S ribosomal protein L24 [Hyphomonadaceae bacterium]OUX93270.1 MAG: 50S ribosomal protein L24 [Hyphomonas sp. TMED17]CAI8418845.1 MAG: 50S ribosomal protein L24 [Hyphomonas sp. TMED17]